MSLNPIKFRYKSDNELSLPSEEEYIGIIAQEVQKVIPEAVDTDNKGYLTLNNDPIFWTMLNAIKEQQHNYLEQKQINNEQKELIQELLERIEKLE